MTSKEIELLEREESRKGIHFGEGACRSMVMSVLTYGGDKESFINGRFSKEYIKTLGKDKVVEIFDDQLNYFENHCIVHYDTYEDCEGCSYNSLEEF